MQNGNQWNARMLNFTETLNVNYECNESPCAFSFSYLSTINFTAKWHIKLCSFLRRSCLRIHFPSKKNTRVVSRKYVCHDNNNNTIDTNSGGCILHSQWKQFIRKWNRNLLMHWLVTTTLPPSYQCNSSIFYILFRLIWKIFVDCCAGTFFMLQIHNELVGCEWSEPLFSLYSKSSENKWLERKKKYVKNRKSSWSCGSASMKHLANLRMMNAATMINKIYLNR